MDDQPAPLRVLLKLSGGAFSALDGAPFSEQAIAYVADELASARTACQQIAVVVGGGNIIRGAKFRSQGPGRIAADYAGMLATVLNALLLRDRLRAEGVPAAHYCAFAIPRMADQFEPAKALKDLESGSIVILAGGTGNPLLTTDTAAALRAVELEAGILLKATRVDGVYSADPEAQAEAKLFKQITYREVVERKLGVMDLPAVSICLKHSLPVRVFNYSTPGNIRRAAAGEPIGTLIGSKEDAR